jgi:hypothetical protein
MKKVETRVEGGAGGTSPPCRGWIILNEVVSRYLGVIILQLWAETEGISGEPNCLISVCLLAKIGEIQSQKWTPGVFI